MQYDSVDKNRTVLKQTCSELNHLGLLWSEINMSLLDDVYLSSRTKQDLLHYNLYEFNRWASKTIDECQDFSNLYGLQQYKFMGKRR